MSDGVDRRSFQRRILPLTCWLPILRGNHLRRRKRSGGKEIDIVRCVPYVIGGFFFSQTGEALFALGQFNLGLCTLHWCRRCRCCYYLSLCNYSPNWLLLRSDSDWGFCSFSRRERDTSDFGGRRNLRSSCCFSWRCNFLNNNWIFGVELGCVAVLLGGSRHWSQLLLLLHE